MGDRIELWNAPRETETWGDVIEIGLRATRIRNPDNLVVVVPNNEIMQRDIINYVMSGEHIRLRIPFIDQLSTRGNERGMVLISLDRHGPQQVARALLATRSAQKDFELGPEFGLRRVQACLVDQVAHFIRVHLEIV